MAEDFYYSASQISSADPAHGGCMRAWAFDKIERFPRKEKVGTERGTEVHAQLEAWVKEGKLPTDPVAKAFLPHIPVKSDGLKIEEEIRLLTPPGVIRGYIDLYVPEPGRVQEALPESMRGFDHPLVIDHKTCKSFRFMKTSETLVKDPQAIIYGLHARVDTGSRGDVELVWNYVSKDSNPKHKQARLRQTLPILEDGVTSILRQAEKMKAAQQAKARANDLEPNLAACGSYGGCPYKLHCAAHVPVSVVPNSTKEVKVSESTLERLKRLREGGAGKAATLPSPEAPVKESPKPVEQVAAPVKEVTPEPTLKPFETKGLDTPLPEAAAGVVPPDAVPNVSEKDAVVVSKGKRGSKKTNLVATDAELLPFLRAKFEAAYAAGDLKTARVLLTALEDLSS
jgi:hypothetical protein